jgi:acyl-CoA synthetase (AMP-forming)/AMP-acid ligase II
MGAETHSPFANRLRQHLSCGGDDPAIIHYSPERAGEVDSATWRQLDARVANCAAGLQAAGLLPGQFVSIIGPSGIDLIACFLACLRLGAIASIFPPPSPLQDHQYYLVQQTKSLQTVNPDHVVVLGAAEGLGASLSEVLSSIHVIAFDPEQQHGGTVDDRSCEGGERVLFVQHSSGTTGIKKGVAISDRLLAVQLETYAEFLQLRSPAASISRPRIACWLPLYHDMGLVACLLLSLYERGTLYLLDPFEWVAAPGSLLDVVDRYRVEYVWLPNFAFRFLSRCFPRGTARDLSSVKLWINCSEPCRLETIEEFVARFGARGVSMSRIGCCYAMAETVFAVSQTPPGKEPCYLQVERTALQVGQPIVTCDSPTSLAVMSNGSLLPGVEVAVWSDRWEGDGVLGELCIRAPFLFEGYYRRPELNASAFRDGFYLTGDIGFTCNGEVYVTGRSKEIIIIHGRNIFATDVEAVANEVPGVKGGRCTAFGIESAASGSEELIVVAEKDARSAETHAQIKRKLTEKIVNEFGIHPRDILVVDERWLVKSTSGKISRSDNRQKYLNQAVAVG